MSHMDYWCTKYGYVESIVERGPPPRSSRSPVMTRMGAPPLAKLRGGAAGRAGAYPRAADADARLSPEGGSR